MNADILHQDIQTLLEFFAKNCYRASDSKNLESFFVNIITMQFSHEQNNKASKKLKAIPTDSLLRCNLKNIWKRQINFRNESMVVKNERIATH